jgi:hypothetical protein
MIPTRWRARLEDQLADAQERVARADEQLRAGEGGRALQAAYQAVVSAATLRVWLAEHPWQVTLAPEEMQQRVQAAFPNLFTALASLDLKDVLTSPWTAEAAGSYVAEAHAYVAATAAELQRCLPQD